MFEKDERVSVVKARRVHGKLRVFAVIGDLGEGDELYLHRLLTWSTFEELVKFCDPKRAKMRTPWDLVSKTVQLGERGSSITGGMSIPVSVGDDADSWTVKLGHDRPLKELVVGETVTLLESEWLGGDGGAIWKVYARPTGGSITVTETGLRVAGIPGANTET